jgi:peptide/nickel transport system substrate-binding protein
VARPTRLMTIWAASVALMAAICVAADPAFAQAPGAVTVALPSDTPALDPTIDTSPIGVNIRLNIFDQLTDVASDGTVQPRLASSWEASPDALVWTFTLRENVKFHDGKPLTIEDVLWTYNKIINDSKSPVRTYLSKIKSMEKLSEQKLRITLIEPFAPFDRQVSLVSIVPKEAYERLGPTQFNQTPIGSGPYRIVRWVKDDRIEMEAFADYWEGPAKVKNALYRPVPAEAARVASLLSGGVDVVPMLPPALAERLGDRGGAKAQKVESHKVIYLGYDVTNGILGNLDFRKAVDASIDREAITSKLLRGLGQPIGQMVTPASFGYDKSVPPTKYDPETAKKLIKSSGYNGEKIVIQYPNNNFNAGDEVMQAVAGYMTAVGINVELQGMEYTAFFPAWAGRKLNSMHGFSYGPTTLDSDLPLTSLYETGRSRGYWSNAKADELVRAQRAEPDAGKRKALITQIWNLSRENVVYSPLYSETHVWGIRDRVRIAPRPDGLVRLKDITLTSN